jgi:lipopolysaccharide transport system permease protein
VNLDVKRKNLQSELVIQAGHFERHYWRDIWSYRELLYFLAWRDVVVRYKQTVIGASWAVIRPFLTMVVFTVVFGKLASLPSGGVPYPILVFAALLPWQFFSSALSDSGNSLIANSHLVSKIYFPRIIIPISAIAVSLVDFAASCLVIIALMAWYGYLPPLQVVFFPVFLLMAYAIAAGLGMFLAALNVRYRDFRLIIPFIVQLGLYISPVGFSSAVIPEKWRLLYALNPMVGVIDGFRWCLLGGEHVFNYESFLISLIVGGVLLWLGIRYFRSTEKSFADVI